MRAAVLVLGFLLAGCLAAGEPRPADWQRGTVLESYTGGKTHNADESYGLRPSGDSAVPAPATCVAYQDARHDTADTCRVAVAGSGWAIEAAWDGSGQRLSQDVEQHPEARTVVAFDAAGQVVAWWDGMHRAGGPYFTE